MRINSFKLTLSLCIFMYQFSLDSSKSHDDRLNDLMSRMTLEDKVYQMNQFVGLDHMRKAEKDLSPEDLVNNDAQGFYKGVTTMLKIGWI